MLSLIKFSLNLAARRTSYECSRANRFINAVLKNDSIKSLHSGSEKLLSNKKYKNMRYIYTLKHKHKYTYKYTYKVFMFCSRINSDIKNQNI